MGTNIDKVKTLMDADETKTLRKQAAVMHLNREAVRTILKRDLKAIQMPMSTINPNAV